MGLAAGIIGAGVLGAGATVYGATKAANAQTSAAANATNAQMQMFNTTQAGLAPFKDAGQSVLPQLTQMAQNGFNFAPTQAQLEQTPGYQFNLSQGEKAVTNSAAARGLGTSGAALRGGADYASGLASNTYQQQFTNALQQYQNNFGNLQGLASMGGNAAAGIGNAATSTGQSIGNNLIGAGNATAAADMSMANGVGSAANNTMLNYMLASKFNLGGMGAAATPAATA
jgi:hypothetical protein